MSLQHYHRFGTYLFIETSVQQINRTIVGIFFLLYLPYLGKYLLLCENLTPYYYYISIRQPHYYCNFNLLFQIMPA